jgi:hypothetical protein
MSLLTPPVDGELEAVCAEIRRLDPNGEGIAKVLRKTLDQLYDGQRTGRYRWDQLFKTEKTHCGTLVEINLQREFKFQDGTKLDYQIVGADLDCKYSQTLYSWMIPPEAHGHLCLVVWADDQKSIWSMGVVRADPDRLNSGSNRDNKATLNPAGRAAISWLFRDAPLSPNVLLHLDRAIVDQIMSIRSGTERLNELFRQTLGMRVSRGVIATVAQQVDYMRRIRQNGGARTPLQSEGIVVLGQYIPHRAIARALGAAEPGPGESVPIRLVSASAQEPTTAEIDGQFWRIATTEDSVVPAPKLPKLTHRERSVVAD